MMIIIVIENSLHDIGFAGFASWQGETVYKQVTYLLLSSTVLLAPLLSSNLLSYPYLSSSFLSSFLQSPALISSRLVSFTISSALFLSSPLSPLLFKSSQLLSASLPFPCLVTRKVYMYVGSRLYV